MSDSGSSSPPQIPTVSSTTVQQSGGSIEGRSIEEKKTQTSAIIPPKNLLWQASPDLLAAITALGFSEVCAEKALFYTGNTSADLAVSWILDNPEAQDDLTPLNCEGLLSSSSSSIEETELSGTSNMYKMIFAVNAELKMGIGKIAAQVGHATLGLYCSIVDRPEFQSAINDWRLAGGPKVVLRAESTEHLGLLKVKAGQLDLASYLVHDAGRTQVAAGSTTVLSIFGPDSLVDQVTGQLKLL